MMWPFKKKTEADIPKKYEFQKFELRKFILKTYEAKIYNEAGTVIGKTCFSDSVVCSPWDGGNCSVDDFPANAYMNQDTYYKFQSFKNGPILVFEDYDENTVSMSTDIIKKIVISIFDEREEEVQLYKKVWIRE